MADVYEQNLAQKSSLTTSDYIRVVGSDNVSYKQVVSDVADKVLGAYPTTTAIADITTWAEGRNGIGIATTNNNTANLPTGVSNKYGVAWCNNSNHGSNIWCNLFWSATSSTDIYITQKTNSGTWTPWAKMPTRAEVDALNAETSGTVTFNTTNVTGSNTGNHWYTKGSLVMANLEFTMLSGKIANNNVICTGLPAPKNTLYAQTGTLQVSVTQTGNLIVYYPSNTTDLTRHELSLAYIKA